MSATWTRAKSVANLHDREVRLTVYSRSGMSMTYHGKADVLVTPQRSGLMPLFLALGTDGFEFLDGKLVGIVSSTDCEWIRGSFDYDLWVRDA